MTGLPSGKAVVAGVTGWPVDHSRSPRLHGHWLARYGIDGLYAPFPIDPSNLDKALRGLAAAGIAGLNVTRPHKEAAYALCDDVDDLAKRLKAVNTLIFDGDGRIKGRNTDVFGFSENVKPGLAASVGRSAVMLGAGGASRAVILALQNLGYDDIRLINRTRERAEQMAETIGAAASVVNWSERSTALSGATLLVNTTSLGMAGQPSLDIVLDDLPVNALVTDIVYIPLETPLLASARARGNPAIDGLDMLLHQGRPGFQAWYGIDPVVDEELRHVVADDLMEKA